MSNKETRSRRERMGYGCTFSRYITYSRTMRHEVSNQKVKNTTSMNRKKRTTSLNAPQNPAIGNTHRVHTQATI